MRGILSFIVVLGALFDTGHCQSGYTLNPVTGNSYRVLIQGRTWDEAKLECESEGAELASIRTTGEWNFVKGLFGSVSGNVFLGGTDAGTEGKWEWTDGSPVPRLPAWYPNKPSTGSSRNCIVAVSKLEWRWVDGICSNSFYAVCKKPGGLLDELKNLKKLSELSIGMTLEEYEAEKIQCSAKGNFFDINTGYCYKYKVLRDTRRTWNEARTQCNTEGGDIASIKSRQEWEVVKGLLKASGTELVWLGGTDEGVEGTWMWIDGSPVTFSDWYPGEPNSGSSGNCMRAWSGSSWRWYDGGCGYNGLYAVCKIPVSA